jgi:ankyrin repeat protein
MRIKYTLIAGLSIISSMAYGAAQRFGCANDYNLLCNACENDDSETVKQLLNKGIDPNIELTWRRWRRPLHIAAAFNANNVARILLKHNATIDPRDYYNATPLHVASAQGHKDAVKLLYAAGADLNARGEYGETPLFNACRNNRFEIVLWLLAHGANPALNARYNQTPLHAAARGGSYRMVHHLVETARLDVHARASHPLDNKSVLAYACENRKPSFELIQYLLGKGLDPYGDGFATSALSHCIENVRGTHGLAIFKLLIAKNIDYAACSEALIKTVKKRHHAISRYLLDELKIDPNILDSEGTSLLQIAEHKQDTQSATLVLTARMRYLQDLAEQDRARENLRLQSLWHTASDRRFAKRSAHPGDSMMPHAKRHEGASLE